MTPDIIAQIGSVYANTVLVVGFILAAGVFASAFGWAIICSKYLEGIARQPEMRAQLIGQMLFSGGLMEAFPMIGLGIAMFFTFANPFAASLRAAIGG
ncbi:F0F1 ATP synthase subunit C [Beggiatoa leptomitoformis]|uniref:ATP synthase subunit c n=1 Tax=Beggiatoa leptomitoformis TaxID=288004 RepID=A0A2N9YHN8_9GAMM|nr:F0F1 ATP synthase subunit C [Beggiatoa leptomitoformis]AUI69895.1 F0F1 ATP synthase subunit C [Beggiatoa leptomitoformis]